MSSLELIPLVSYPKSGNTWFRFFLANVYKRNSSLTVDFSNINKFTCTSFSSDFSQIKTQLVGNAPVFVKQHVNYGEMTNIDFEKAIYIYRNGFDMLYSYWHFTEARSPGLFKDIYDFADCYQMYCGHWGEHLDSWMLGAGKSGKHKVHFVSYEEMLANPFSTARACLEFLGNKISDAELQLALDLSSKERMKSMDGSQKFMKSTTKDFHFVRSGVLGEGKERLPVECMNKFMSHQKNYQYMHELGYLKNAERQFEQPVNLKDSILKKMSLKYRSKMYSVISRLQRLGS